MSLLGILITLLFVGLFGLRIVYMYEITDVWNKNLELYIEERIGHDPLAHNYYQQYYLKHWKYWLRLDVWSVKSIVWDNILYDDVMAVNYRESIRKVK
jgi:hypothetical protein